MKRHRPGMADWLVTVLSPILVMGLVGSLTFFLAAVFYAGTYPERLNWTLFFFVMGAVLVARVAIEIDTSRAMGYGIALGAVVFLAMLRFVTFAEASSAARWGWLINLGLIVLVGWSAHQLTWDCTFIDERRPASGKGLLEAAGDAAATTSPSDPPPHTPGLWVIGFTLAALPLFGLGQACVPASDLETRRLTFLLMCGYVASALGLLLTTHFLGLRHYLRQRGLSMPASMAGVWVLMGGGLIVGLLAVAALLPRPYGEYAWLQALTSHQSRSASAKAMWAGSAGQDEGDPRSGEPGGERPGNRADGPPDADGESQGGSPTGEQSGNASSRSSPGSSRQGQSHGPRDGPSSASSRSPRLSFGQTWEALAHVLKWVVFAGALIALAVGLIAFLSRRSRAKKSRPATPEIVDAVLVAPRQPFASFFDPFTMGLAEVWSTAELIQYSFSALEAWAAERELSRHPWETPLEFGRRLADSVTELAESAPGLASWLARLEYAPGKLPEKAREDARQFWSDLAAMTGSPMHAPENPLPAPRAASH